MDTAAGKGMSQKIPSSASAGKPGYRAFKVLIIDNRGKTVNEKIDKTVYSINMWHEEKKGIYEYGNSKRSVWFGKAKCRGDDPISEWA